MQDHFVDVTEIEGQPVSTEQLLRTCHRYHWAAEICAGRDVLEVACGSGPGLELLLRKAKSVVAGDVSTAVLEAARKTYGDAIALHEFDATSLPFDNASFDAILLFEALYYIESPELFFREAARVLQPGGKLLIVTANRDLYDFNPSPFSRRYLGVQELTDELGALGFDASFGGFIDVRHVGWRQRVFRPAKLIATRLGLIPKTMHGKAWLKRIVFGEMAIMPASIADVAYAYQPPAALEKGKADQRHKVIYCVATKIGNGG